MVEHISRGTTLTMQKFRRLAFQQLKRKKLMINFKPVRPYILPAWCDHQNRLNF